MSILEEAFKELREENKAIKESFKIKLSDGSYFKDDVGLDNDMIFDSKEEAEDFVIMNYNREEFINGYEIVNENKSPAEHTSLNEEENDNSDEYEYFEDYAEDYLPYEARYKEVYMDPEDAGKLNVTSGHEGKCDLLWVCQGDCDMSDFKTLMNCFGKFYKKHTNDKTYTAIMKSRSYPGAGNFIKRVVSFKNGKCTIKDEEPKEVCSGNMELFPWYDEYEDGFCFRLYADAEDIEAFGKTIKDVKHNFVSELNALDEYVECDPGYEVDHNEVNLDYENDEYSIEDFLKGKSQDELDELIDLVNEYNVEPIGEGTYITYQKLSED